jgi:hypothetical protein
MLTIPLRIAQRFGSTPWELIPDCEPRAKVLRLFELINQRDGVVVIRDSTLAILSDDQLIPAQAEFSGTLAGSDDGGRRKKCPVELLIGTQELQKLRSFIDRGQPFGRNLPRIL